MGTDRERISFCTLNSHSHFPSVRIRDSIRQKVAYNVYDTKANHGGHGEDYEKRSHISSVSPCPPWFSSLWLRLRCARPPVVCFL